MHYGAIKEFSIENGPGVRVSFFVSGCRNHCPDCFSVHTWDFAYGLPYDQRVEEKLIQLLEPDYIDGLTILGGEPLEPENQPVLRSLTAKVKDVYPEKTIWIYTGFVFEELAGSRADTQNLMPLLQNCDIMVDGPFRREERNLSLAFRGSENQRILDLKKSISQGTGIPANL